jgi:uncharacterized protein with PQ loop repeat
VLSALSFQEKNNSRLLIWQGMSGFMFVINFALVGAVSAALFNLVNALRGALFSRKEKKMWQLTMLNGLYTACFVFSLFGIINNPFQIFLSTITFVPLVIMTVLMWKGNGKHIRIFQFFVSSPGWLIHNIFNFSLGGILCEIFAMLSIIISFIRFGKDGFEK